MGTATGEAPRTQNVRHHVPATTIAADSEVVIGTVDETGVISSVTYYADATLTGAATNFRTVTLYDRKADGSGTVALATLVFSSSGVVATEWIGKAITLNATPANLNVTAGDVLTWSSTHTASGLVDPGGLVQVAIARD